MRGSTRHDRQHRLRPAGFRLHEDVLAWFDVEARDLPWRRDTSPWSVMVSEFMLQQTPVSRVLPIFKAWMARWPTPAALAADTPGEAVRAWGRLGYPRRALRLHAAATAIVERHGGDVPSEHDELLALPGVGDYTASAVASFAFGARHPVLDTNVRRVFARVVEGVAFPSPSVTAAEKLLADLADAGARRAPLGGRDDGARRPRVLSPRTTMRGLPDRDSVQVASRRLSRARGTPTSRSGLGRHRPSGARPPDGRAARGRRTVTRAQLDAVWDDPVQRDRCLDTLVFDGLVEPLSDELFALPA